MIAARTKDGYVVYVSFCEDVEPNEGGYYCQVYTEPTCDCQIDDFCIYTDEITQPDMDKDEAARQYVKQQTYNHHELRTIEEALRD